MPVNALFGIHLGQRGHKTMGTDLLLRLQNSAAAWGIGVSPALASAVTAASWVRACAALVWVCFLCPLDRGRPRWALLRGILIPCLCLWAFGIFSVPALCVAGLGFLVLETELAKAPTSDLRLLGWTWAARFVGVLLMGYLAMWVPSGRLTNNLWQHALIGGLLVRGAGFLVAVWLGGQVVDRLVDRTVASWRGKGVLAGDEALPADSAMIGLLERVLVFLFVLGGRPEGLGYVLIAKCILHFNELRADGRRYRMEYIMIRTFASFAWAIAASQLTIWALVKLLGVPS